MIALLQPIKVFVAFGEHERRSALADGLNDLVANSSIPELIIDQVLGKALGIRLRLSALKSGGRLKRGRTDDDRVLERPRRRLRPCVHSMPDRTALHEDDWMVPILPGDRRG